MIGKRLGPYLVVDKLGEGGMGEVYRARDTRLGREVVIKIYMQGDFTWQDFWLLDLATMKSRALTKRANNGGMRTLDITPTTKRSSSTERGTTRTLSSSTSQSEHGVAACATVAASVGSG